MGCRIATTQLCSAENGRGTPRLATNGLQARLVGGTPALKGPNVSDLHPSQIRIRCGAVHENASLPHRSGRA
jgi:hypothetical protein